MRDCELAFFYFHWGLCFMHSFLRLFGSVCLGKKNSWHFQWTHTHTHTQVFNNSVATEGEQWSKHTQQFHFIGADSVLLLGKIWCGSRQVQLFIQALPRMERCVCVCVCVCVTNCNEAQKREKHNNSTDMKSILSDRRRTEPERQRESVSEKTCVSCLWSNRRKRNSFDIDWGLVLSNQTLNNFSVQEKTETSSLLSFVKTGRAIYFLG